MSVGATGIQALLRASNFQTCGEVLDLILVFKYWHLKFLVLLPCVCQ